MMSSFETSSPVSASTLAYLMRWPVFLLIWLKLIFSESEVAGYKATGQVTSEMRKKPFQLARGAIEILQTLQIRIQDDPASLVPTFKLGRSPARALFVATCQYVHFLFCIWLRRWSMQITYTREEIERRRRQILRQRREIRDLQRAGIPTKSAEELLTRMQSKVDDLCAERDRLVGQCRIAKRA